MRHPLWRESPSPPPIPHRSAKKFGKSWCPNAAQAASRLDGCSRCNHFVGTPLALRPPGGRTDDSVLRAVLKLHVVAAWMKLKQLHHPRGNSPSPRVDCRLCVKGGFETARGGGLDEAETTAPSEGQFTLPPGWTVDCVLRAVLKLHVVAAWMKLKQPHHPRGNSPSPREGQKFAQRISGEGGSQCDRRSNKRVAVRSALQRTVAARSALQHATDAPISANRIKLRCEVASGTQNRVPSRWHGQSLLPFQILFHFPL